MLIKVCRYVGCVNIALSLIFGHVYMLNGPNAFLIVGLTHGVVGVLCLAQAKGEV